MSNRNTIQYFAFFDDTINEISNRGNPRWTTSWETRYTEKRFKILGFIKKGRTQYSWDSPGTVPIYHVFKPAVTLAEINRGMRVGIRRDQFQLIDPKSMYLKQEDGRRGVEVLWMTRTSIWYACQKRWIPVVGAIEPDRIMGNYLYEAEPDSYDQCFARQLEQQAERVQAQRIMEGIPPYRYAEELQPGFSPSPYEDVDSAIAIEEAMRRSLEEEDSADSEEEGGAAGGGAAGGGGGGTAATSLGAVVVAAALSAPAAPAAAAAQPLPSAPQERAAATAATAAPQVPRYVLELVKRDAVSKGESCPISMTPFQECSSTTVTSCFHLFETESIRTWLSTKDCCPVCKQKVVSQTVV
jgi:hypothetical protein